MNMCEYESVHIYMSMSEYVYVNMSEHIVNMCVRTKYVV